MKSAKSYPWLRWEVSLSIYPLPSYPVGRTAPVARPQLPRHRLVSSNAPTAQLMGFLRRGHGQRHPGHLLARGEGLAIGGGHGQRGLGWWCRAEDDPPGLLPLAMGCFNMGLWHPPQRGFSGGPGRRIDSTSGVSHSNAALAIVVSDENLSQECVVGTSKGGLIGGKGTSCDHEN